MQRTQYSVVIPVYKAGKTLAELVAGISKAMNLLNSTYEIIMVDDGSPDDSWQVMNELKGKYASIKILRLSKNFGQLAATTCGIQNASGETIITMDDDLQFSPDELPALVSFFETHEYKLVFGIPAEKMDSRFHHLNRTFAQLLFRNIFLYRYRNIEYFSSLRILSAGILGERRLGNIFMIWKLAPENIGNFAVKHYPTLKDNTSYTYWKRVKHFEPYILLAAQKGTLFIAAFCILALIILHFSYAASITSRHFAVALFIDLFLLIVSSYVLKLEEKVDFRVESVL